MRRLWSARKLTAQERADALGGEPARIRGRGGWRGALLRLAGATPRSDQPPAHE